MIMGAWERGDVFSFWKIERGQEGRKCQHT